MASPGCTVDIRTFVILTDREDLDAQIYKTFVSCGAVPPPGKSKKGEREHGLQARSAEHLQQLLREDHRYVFTLIQKFRTDVKGGTYPKLSLGRGEEQVQRARRRVSGCPPGSPRSLAAHAIQEHSARK